VVLHSGCRCFESQPNTSYAYWRFSSFSSFFPRIRLNNTPAATRFLQSTSYPWKLYVLSEKGAIKWLETTAENRATFRNTCCINLNGWSGISFSAVTPMWLNVYYGINWGLSCCMNYTDRSTAACQRSYYQRLRIECVAWSAQRISTAVFSHF
jgi:hypothetical protein